MKDDEFPDLWNEIERKESPAHEFAPGASEWIPSLSRRRFLELSGAGIALAGLGACTRPALEKMVPYVTNPKDVAPGRPLYFATSHILGGLATGLLVETHMGRPTKIEGNPDHPASRGAASAIHQASILDLYDLDRNEGVRHLGSPSDEQTLIKTFRAALEEESQTRGRAVALLTDFITSPTILAMMEDIHRRFPELHWVQYEPFCQMSAERAAEQVFGRALTPIYRFDQADVVISFDADFFTSSDAPVRYAQDFAGRRRGGELNRLFVAECTPSITGAKATERRTTSTLELRSLAREFEKSDSQHPWARAARAADGRAIFVAGDHLPMEFHRFAHEMNVRHGRSSVRYIPAVRSLRSGLGELKSLIEKMRSGDINTLIIAGGNPIYNTPGSFGFRDALKQVNRTLRLGRGFDETSNACHWHAPIAHDFEVWGDARAYDGTISLLQPVIGKLFPSRSLTEYLSRLFLADEKSDRSVLENFWKMKLGERWRASLEKGFIEGSAETEVHPAVRKHFEFPLVDNSAPLEIVFRPDPRVWDGRYANNAWLQELPHPISRLTWDNAALISPALARKRSLRNGQLVQLNTKDGTLVAPVLIQPGQPAHTVTLALGFGRTMAGKIGNHIGSNAFPIWQPDGATTELHPSADQTVLAVSQTFSRMEGRKIIRVLDAPVTGEKLPRTLPSLFDQSPKPEEPYAWAMTIDLDSCIGCGACVTACQSENNIHCVGKEQVALGREMHWLRVDRYYSGSADDPEILFQPVPCMHCEKAPCEPVCPVGATTHGNGGLNQMTYNRCIGTRYCSNNCPYKVRRFNFLTYKTGETSLTELQKNPEVSVRPRGVMEKCTYCVQRINRARMTAEKENRLVRDGEVQTACQMTCPTRAIHFGNQKDPQSDVAKKKKSVRNYALLEELGTKPRTTYLARLRDKESK